MVAKFGFSTTCEWCPFGQGPLGGGNSNVFLCSPLPGEMIQFDGCIFFKWVGEKPPTRFPFGQRIISPLGVQNSYTQGIQVAICQSFSRGQVSKDGKRTRRVELNIFDVFCQEGEGVHILGCLPAQDAVHHQDDIIFLVGDPDLNLYLQLASWEGAHNPMHMFHTLCSCGCYLAGMQSQMVDRTCSCSIDSFDHQKFQVPKMRESSPI